MLTSKLYGDTDARLAISNTIAGLDYNSETGVWSLATGYVIPTTTEESNWNTAYGWGDHAGLYDAAGTAASAVSSHESTYDHSLIATAVQTETDPVVGAINGIVKANGAGAISAATAGTDYLNASSQVNHDETTGFVANEHIDWTNATANLATTGTGTFGGQLQGPGGTEAAPTYSFAGDPDTGFYRYADNSFAFACGGSTVLFALSTHITASVPIYTYNGSAEAPIYSFTSDVNTGIFRAGEGSIGFATNGTIAGAISTSYFTCNRQIACIAGSAASPAFSIAGDLDTGMYRIAADILGFATGGTERARMSSAGLQATGFVASDGTAGATSDIAVAKVGGGTRTLHFKNGLCTGYTDS